jgi:putative glutamine amidotransferase
MPVVGVTGYLSPPSMSKDRGLGDSELAIFALNYFEKALAFGLLPVGVPNLEPSDAEQYLNLVDALIFTGGTDIDPALYGQSRHPGLGVTIRDRDEFELVLARAAIERGLPILGICRGLQILNVVMGGGLEQDLAPASGYLRHNTGGAIPEFHEVTVLAGELVPLLGERTRVNSLHHQAVRELAPGLSVAACSPDGVIEAAIGIDRPVLGVQWHPEQLALGDVAGDVPYQWLRSRLLADFPTSG